MLKISAFAKLAHTTRRTLIVYDQQAIFKPAKVSPEGYRYYQYDQLYELSFILTLRKLGLSLPEIRQLNPVNPQISTDGLLQNLQTKVDGQLQDLLTVKAALATRQRATASENMQQSDLPYLINHQQQAFWQTPRLTDCSRQQIAKTFADFYQHLEPLATINGKCSGFLLELDQPDATKVNSAPFSLIKEAIEPINDAFVTTTTRAAGEYLAIETTNDELAICAGIAALQQYARTQKITLTGLLWQINLTADIRAQEATTERVRLEYQLAV